MGCNDPPSASRHPRPRPLRLHKLHHWEVYPPAKFFGDEDNEVHVTHTSWVTAHEALLYIGLVVILACLAAAGVSLPALGFALVGVSIIGYTGK